MRVYHGSETFKQECIAHMQAHIADDNLVQGKGWANGKGCSIGCTFDIYDHQTVADKLGTALWLEKLRDKIHEGLPSDNYQWFLTAYLEALQINANVEKIRIPFIRIVLDHALETVKQLNVGQKLKQQIIEVNRVVYNNPDCKEAQKKAAAAADAAADDDNAVLAAVWAAAAAADAAVVWVAVWDAVWADADAAADDVWAVVWDADAADAAKTRAYTYFANELVSLLRGQKITVKSD